MKNNITELTKIITEAATQHNKSVDSMLVKFIESTYQKLTIKSVSRPLLRCETEADQFLKVLRDTISNHQCRDVFFHLIENLYFSFENKKNRHKKIILKKIYHCDSFHDQSNDVSDSALRELDSLLDFIEITDNRDDDYNIEISHINPLIAKIALIQTLLNKEILHYNERSRILITASSIDEDSGDSFCIYDTDKSKISDKHIVSTIEKLKTRYKCKQISENELIFNSKKITINKLIDYDFLSARFSDL